MIYSVRYTPYEIRKHYDIACRYYHVLLNQQKRGRWKIRRRVRKIPTRGNRLTVLNTVRAHLEFFTRGVWGVLAQTLYTIWF